MTILSIVKLSAATIGAAFIVGGLFADAARAALTLVASRSALGADEVVNWKALGQPYTSIPNPIAVTSTPANAVDPNAVTPDSVPVCGLVASACRVGVTVSKAAGPFQLIVQENGGSWSGDFPQGDYLLFTGRSSVGGPITFDFNVPVLGVGTQIQAAGGNRLGSTFSFLTTIEAFDPLGNSLGSFSVTGLSSFGSTDKPVTYIGVASDSANIAKVTIDGEKVLGSGFAIDRLDLVTVGSIGSNR